MDSLHRKLFIELLKVKLETKEEIKYDSFFTLIEEYLNLEKSIENATNETVNYLKRAREDYIKDILFEVESSPFFQFKNYYSGDLLTIKTIMKAKDVDYELLKIILTTFHKKRTVNYFTNVQKILESENRIDFKFVFILVDNVLQEIKYHNFSYEKIKSLLRYSENELSICLDIQKAYNSVGDNPPFCLIKIEVPSQIENKNLLVIDNIKLYRVFDSEWNLQSNMYTNLYNDQLEKYYLTDGNKSLYTSKGNLYLFESESVEGTDYRIKIRKAVKSIESNLKGLVSNTGSRKKNIVHNIALTFSDSEPNNFTRFNVNVAGNKATADYKNRYEKNVEEFNNNYLQVFQKENFKLDSFKTIYNLLDLIKNASEMTLENRLVILWSCLEKICVDLNKKAIIQKVLSVITQSHLMYVLKEDLNDIWHRIIDKKLELEIDVFKQAMVDQTADFIKYKPKELCGILKEMNQENKEYILEKDIILAGMIDAFLNNTNNKENIRKYLKIEKSRMEQKIRRIYRHRNILTHTHVQKDFDIIYFVEMLEKYLSGLVSIIIHYTLRNPELTIRDIIYAIDQTFTYYESTIIENENIETILKPHYLLL